MTVPAAFQVPDSADVPGSSEEADPLERLLGAVRHHVEGLNGPGMPALRRLRVASGAVSVEIEWDPLQDVVPPVAEPVDAPDPLGEVSGLLTVRAPAVGTFYRAREPEAPPFVEVGDIVQANAQVGILETMKLMSALNAERAGRIIELPVPDGAPVEYDQVLAVMEPVGE
ncbi:hypothetical protein NE236_25865 [Actinoallomurus purpureus]|uniref:acetyl-CoA carboxylase biotin carboxyl carrier protein n=1 Tax=Actinoallomurus purpureus TaxID=478114 RepID=UPI0020937E5D|nr:biotin/lipoyl-containing protein [Actinoallomurus purpureus]MCO6008408.1 hypothetical protein [Actinoallomurus purpureus]